MRVTFRAIVPKKQRAPSKKIAKALDAYTAGFALQLLENTVFYPPPVEGSRYVRTYRLLKAWRITRIPYGYQVSNRASDKGREYAIYVHGSVTDPARQVWYHRLAGWKNIAEELDKLGGKGQFQAGAQAIISGNLNGA